MSFLKGFTALKEGRRSHTCICAVHEKKEKKRNRVTCHACTGQPCAADRNRWGNANVEYSMFQGGIMSYIIPHKRQRCICAFAWEHHLTYWCAAPPTVRARSTAGTHRSVLIKHTISNPVHPSRLNMYLADKCQQHSSSKLIAARMQKYRLLYEGHNHRTWGTVVWLRTLMAPSSLMNGLRRINLQTSSHHSGYNPIKSINCVLETLALLRKHNLLLSAHTKPLE